MISKFAPVVLVILIACETAPREGDRGTTAPAGSSTAGETSTTRSTPGGGSSLPPVTEKRDEITIESVEVANPLVISGRARTFENNVAIRVRGAGGTLLEETFTTSAGEMGSHNPYRASVWLTRDPGNEVVVEALEYSAKDGSERNLVSVSRPYGVEGIGVTLFFPDADCTGVRSFRRTVPKSIAMARLLVEALIDGPTATETKSGAVSPFPERSAVRSVSFREGTVTVDFDERLQNAGGSCRAQMIRRTVTDTLMALPSVKKVIITAGGSEALALQP